MMVAQACMLSIILLLVRSVVGIGFENVSIPTLDYSAVGGEIGVLGHFDAVSLYSYVNASSFLTSNSTQDSTRLYLFDGRDRHIEVATLNGEVTSMERISRRQIILNGNFTRFNDEDVVSPVIFDVSRQEVTPVFAPSNRRDATSISNGKVNTVFVDDDLIYLGGDFQYGDSYGLAIYNRTSNRTTEAPFRGFGENSSVNAINKISSGDDEELGSIIFGGSFDTLGLNDLLKHNMSLHSNHNHTNSSLITAEQKISLRHGTFSSVNSGGGDESSVICPSNGDPFSFASGQGGQWAVELPDEMKGLTPTKVRIYIPEGSDGIQTFRIYSYPNNGIMNLTYIDPGTNEIAHCDASCPLSTVDELEESLDSNLQNIDDLDDDETYVDSEDGSLSRYYDDSTQTKTLSYGRNFQEFAFLNSIAIDRIGLTVVAWHGSQGILGGFEVYSNVITVYGNDSLNQPNCDGENDDNSARISSGDFVSVKTLAPGVVDTDYMVSTNTDARLTLYPNISYSGNYSIIMTTPGCTLDDSCGYRSIVNVSVYEDSELLDTRLIYQNNNEEKFDYLFYGHLEGSETDDSETRIEISYYDSIVDSDTHWMVVDKIRADIVDLDDYMDTSRNSTHNSTSNIGHIKLNGLFEYSLANFTYFDEDLVSYDVGDERIISKHNTFVGNSSINQLSGELSRNANISNIVVIGSENEELVITGDFESESDDLRLEHTGILSIDVSSYNNTLNETSVSDISKRAQDSSVSDLDFNDTISSTVAYDECLLVLGSFHFDSNDLSTRVLDLSRRNDTADSLDNFAMFCDNHWYSFGNDFFDSNFDRFTSISINGDEYLVFSSSDENRVWNKNDFSWTNDSTFVLDISSAVGLHDGDQLVAGSNFNVMDYYGTDQTFLNESNFERYETNITSDSGVITTSFYVNDSLKIIGGHFASDTYQNLAFIDRSSENMTIYGLEGSSNWSENTTVQSVAVSNDQRHLFFGINGSIELGSIGNHSGLSLYDLDDNSFLESQPAMLTTSNGENLEINAIVYNDDMELVLVGGNFINAGSLSCVGLCIYDLSRSRWVDPQSTIDYSIEGTVTDIRFYQSKKVLISGNLTSDGNSVNFISYDFDKESFDSDLSLNNLGTSRHVSRFIFNDENNGHLQGRTIAFGDNFISCFDGSRWHSIDGGIRFGSTTSLRDIKLLNLEDSNSNNDETYFDDDKILALAGAFELDDYGFVNLAFFNSTDWIPFLYSSVNNDERGSVNSILIKDTYNFQTSDDVNRNGNLSRGRVVGISLACAIGSTTFMGLLYIIPYFALFRKQKKEETNQRIQEKEMMGAVNPEELLHEIDIQRNH